MKLFQYISNWRWTLKFIASFFLINTTYAIYNEAISQNRDAQIWNSAIIDWNFTQGWLVELELDYNRLLSEGPVWREYATQPSVEFYPNNSLDLFAGVYLTNTKQNDTEDSKEIRPLIGFRWNIIKPEKRVFLRTQIKYEYRFFENTTTGTHENIGRLRMRLDLFVPITKTSYSEDKNLYGITWSEVYVNFDNEIQEKYQSTFRQYLGLGYRFSYSWRLEVDYVFQAARDAITDENADTLSSVVFITLKFYVPK